jgi:hypothetical protein
MAPQRAACEVLERALGHPHPQLALCLANEATLYAAVGEHARSIELKRDALAMFLKVPGQPNHVAMVHRNLARSHLELGEREAARAQIAQARAVPSAELDVDTLAWLERRASDDFTKMDVFLDEYFQRERRKGLEAWVLFVDAALGQGQTDVAWRAAQRASNLASAAYPEGSCRRADAQRTFALALSARQEHAAASRAIDAAAALLQGAEVDPALRARVEFAKARVLESTAAALANAAAKGALGWAPPHATKLRTEIEAWLARPPR